MGFRYGYSQAATLVLWEAQFGDFVNSAPGDRRSVHRLWACQVGTDLSLDAAAAHTATRARAPSIPGAPGALPGACAEGNIRVANLTTPAQYFHLLRRQARIAKQRPLVIMTPKSLLRLPQATNTVADLGEGSRFQPVLAEPGVPR